MQRPHCPKVLVHILYILCGEPRESSHCVPLPSWVVDARVQCGRCGAILAQASTQTNMGAWEMNTQLVGFISCRTAAAALVNGMNELRDSLRYEFGGYLYGAGWNVKSTKSRAPSSRMGLTYMHFRCMHF